MRIPIENSTSYRGRHSRPNWLALLAFVALGFAVGGLGALVSPAFSAPSAAWYGALAKPLWTPVIRAALPAASVQYLSMGVAAWMVWGERYHSGRPRALLAFAVQLLLNGLWAPLLFGARSTGLGLLVAVALGLALIWTTREFLGVRAAAACLMLPCVAWGCFAAALNFAIWRLNP